MKLTHITTVGPLVVTLLASAIGVPIPATADVLLDGSEFQVNTYTTGSQYHPAVSAAADGGFIVVWQGNGESGDDRNVHGQRYDDTGAAIGTEFPVNTTTATSGRCHRAVSAADDGGFVVIWGGVSNGNCDHSLHAQRYDSTGAAIGAEFGVGTGTGRVRVRPAVASSADGSFVVAWTGKPSGYCIDCYNVHAQRFDSAGVTAGPEFQVNTFTEDYQESPAVAAAADGRFVVVWTSGPQIGRSQDGQDGSAAGVFGQRLSATGQRMGTEFLVNTYTTGDQGDVFDRVGIAVSASADGRFVVVWRSEDQDGSGGGIFAQRFDAAGARQGTEFQVNAYTTGDQDTPVVAVAADGSFIIGWRGEVENGREIFARRYDSSGIAHANQFQVNAYSTGLQIEPAISTSADGRFVVVWTSSGHSVGESDQDGDLAGVFGQLLCGDDDANGVCDNRDGPRSCGDPASDQEITAVDALYVLSSAIAVHACDACVCDADGSGTITASDALRVLAVAAGQDFEVMCPPCA